MASSGSRSLIRIGSSLQRGAAAEAGGVDPTEHRRVDHADHRATVGHQRDRHADDGEAVHEVGGAVERVDEPADVGALTTGLLAEERELGRGVVQELADRVLARRVGVAHPVAGTLRAHVARAAERVEHDRGTRRGRTPGGVEQPVEIEVDRSPSGPSVQLLEQFLRARGDELTTGVGVEHDQVTAVGVDDQRARFLAHEQRAEVVPRRVLVGVPVEVAVEVTRGDVAQRRGRPNRARGTGASRAGSGGQPDKRDDRAVRRRWSTAGAIAVAVELGAGAPHRGVASAGGPVLHQRRIHGPSASSAHSEIAQYGMPRAQLVDPSTGSSTTVTSASTGPVQPDSSLSTRRPGGVQDREHGGVGDEVEAVLPGAIGAGAAIAGAEGCERAALRGGRDVEHGEQVVGRHRDAASTVTTAL